jgi:hypothetical protein
MVATRVVVVAVLAMLAAIVLVVVLTWTRGTPEAPEIETETKTTTETTTTRAKKKVAFATRTPARPLGTKPLMLISAAKQSAINVDFAQYIAYIDLRAHRYLNTASGVAAVSDEPDPTCTAAELGWTLHDPQVALCVSRGSFYPAYYVTASGKDGFARADGGVVTYTPSVDVDDDAYWWIVAADAAGAVYNASAPRFEGVQGYSPGAFTKAVPQPATGVAPNYGTQLTKSGCATVVARTSCSVARDNAATCAACNYLPPMLCALAAQHGACGPENAPTPFGSLCAVSCAVQRGISNSIAGGLRVTAMDRRVIRPIIAPSAAMYMPAGPTDAQPMATPTMQDLHRALESGRWLNADSDPSFGSGISETWPAKKRRYMNAVLLAMTMRRLDEAGTCWFADAHGGFTSGGGTVPMESTAFRTDVTGPTSNDCIAMCVGGPTDRFLSYYGVLDLCKDRRLGAGAWNSCSNDLATRKGFTRQLNAASCVDAYGLVTFIRTGAVEKAVGNVESPMAKTRLRALMTQDYSALGWPGIQAMFNLANDELAALQTAVVPYVAMHVAKRSMWRTLQPRQRLQLVQAWNEGALFAFARTDAESRTPLTWDDSLNSGDSLLIRLPKRTGSAPPTKRHVASHFPFQHAFWPSDRLTASGKTVVTRDGDGNVIASVPRSCLRCPSDPALRSAVESESTTCRYAPYDVDKNKEVQPAFQKCISKGHSEWKAHSNTPSGSYYETDGSVTFLHGVFLDDGLTNLSSSFAREKVRVCASTSGWSNVNGFFPWAPFTPYSPNPRTLPWNPFRVTRMNGPPVQIFNDLVRGVRIPPGFAVYVTPHYHGFHASAHTCHHGIPHLRGVPGTKSLIASSTSPGFFTHELQCRVASWTPHLKEHPKDEPEPNYTETPGIILINDDLGSSWFVSPGDNLNEAGEFMIHKGKAVQGKSDLFFPTHVNCIAAWNFFAYPRHWLQRGNADPNDGDSIPAFDAVASDDNNIRSTSDSLSAFFDHSMSLNVRVILRTGNTPVQKSSKS